MAISGLGVAYATTGIILFWSGFTGNTIKDTLTGFLKGTVPAHQQQEPPTIGVNNNTQQGATGSVSSGAPVFQGTGTSGGTPSSNQNLAKLMAGNAHPSWITGQEWADWVSLWNRESGWSQTADTRKTGLDSANASVFAYGIPQARPYTKMPKAGWPPDKGGKSDPSAQISWGIQYIAATYGSPSKAWAHETAHGWY